MSDLMRMHALADGQLDGEEKLEAEKQLASCNQSRAEYQTVLALKKTLAAKCEKHVCARTWRNCMSRLDEIEKARRVERFVGKYAWGLCGGFLLVLVLAAVQNRMDGSQNFRTGDVAKIVSGLGEGSSGSHNQSEDMSKWIRRAPVALDTERVRVDAFVGGYYEGRGFARFDLRDATGPFRLLIIEGDTSLAGTEPVLDNGNYQSCKVNGMNCVTWNDGGFTMFVLSPRATEEIVRLAEILRTGR